ncbi:uncharacterized protein LOC135390148 [Ornithodoros turicata]|uniref:uncharacterized protein LOC135390148 n=1 Tax=Ornithodoros turicata TaxID=34597 RepID=UPI003138E6E1
MSSSPKEESMSPELPTGIQEISGEYATGTLFNSGLSKGPSTSTTTSNVRNKISSADAEEQSPAASRPAINPRIALITAALMGHSIYKSKILRLCMALSGISIVTAALAFIAVKYIKDSVKPNVDSNTEVRNETTTAGNIESTRGNRSNASLPLAIFNQMEHGETVYVFDLD